MPTGLLRVSHRQQTKDGDCLPTCVEMVLDFQKVNVNKRRLRRTLRSKWFGTPFENVKYPTNYKVTFGHFLPDEIHNYLAAKLPVIAGIRTGDLTYWNNEDTDHVVVILGMNQEFVIVNDPILSFGEKRIPMTEFELARIAFNDLCAVIQAG